jgi:hypothetical protein
MKIFRQTQTKKPPRPVGADGFLPRCCQLHPDTGLPMRPLYKKHLGFLLILVLEFLYATSSVDEKLLTREKRM